MSATIKERLDEIICSEENIEELYAIFNSIDDYSLPIIRFYIYEGRGLIRQRLNLKEQEFYNISELSYPPVSCCKSYGRANIPYHPMFYCSSFAADSNAPLPRYTTLLETSQFFWDKEKRGIERSTFSRWDIIKTLNLLALPFSKNYNRTIADIQQIQKEWDIEQKRNNINKNALELVNYMSNEIAKKAIHDTDYFKIANFVYYLLYINKKTKDSDGIIYPSVEAAGEGLNVALKPESVDEKLNFSGASLCYLVKDKMEAELIAINESVGHNDDGTFIYKNLIDVDIDAYKDYEFIN